MAFRIGIDTGGTFTDVVIQTDEGNELAIHKVHSTREEPDRAVIEGLRQALRHAEAEYDDIQLLVHGTTVATNALLQRRGSRAALITTAGFRDILHIQRQSRPRLYDLRSRRAEPLIPRQLRFELNERIGPDAEIQTPVDFVQLHTIVDQLREANVGAVAVALLHSYENPVHELEVAAVVRERLPGVTVCTSHELSPQIGEYERFSTCSVNAFVQPVMERYLGRLDRTLRQDGIRAPLFVMKSNGGVIPASTAARECVQTILSGPAGGIVAGMAIAQHHNNSNVITADIGGTSFDVAVIADGNASFARDAEIDGIALKAPMLDLHTIGAGGGSIGWIDAGNALRVGPQSAGALPGPACYGKGGDEPTVTDANLVLGRLATDSRLAGGMQLDIDAARRAIREKLAQPLGLAVESAAEGIVRVVNANMVAAIRKLTVERGLDPGDFVLIPFGGAGPLHGAQLAQECGIGQTLVPSAPGVTSAVGLLMSNLREDRVVTHIELLDNLDAGRLESLLAEVETETASRLQAASDGTGVSCRKRTMAIRYLGQSHDVPVPLTPGTPDVTQIAEDFHQSHERMYGFSRPDQQLELVSIWVTIELDIQPLVLPRGRVNSRHPDPGSMRSVIFHGERHRTPVYDRSDLGAGCRITGPAIVEQTDSTTVIWPGQGAAVDDYGQILLDAMT
ncbi:MAG: hydantoinase/oxoprolinase family protein [Fuerstiella sp.]|nr:hydantoinase/oxoprolinase family protein [Fuerstiella sp.]